MSRKSDALHAMALRGGTPNERAVATAKLANLPAIRSEEADDTWTPAGMLTRDRRGAKAYLRGTALVYFLRHVKDMAIFNNRSIPLAQDEFGSGDFYMVLSWLLRLDLCIKTGSKYQVTSKADVVRAWNQQMEALKI